MKLHLFVSFALILIGCHAIGQTDTTAKLKDAQNLWASFNNSGQSDTTVFAQMLSDYTQVLSVDSLNANANRGLGDVYNSFSNYWFNMAQPIESSSPTQYNSYIQESNGYSVMASPYLQRYLRIKKISN